MGEGGKGVVGGAGNERECKEGGQILSLKEEFEFSMSDKKVGVRNVV